MNNTIPNPKKPLNKAFLKIKTNCTEIDRLVYELYGLTAEEIAVVENSVK